MQDSYFMIIKEGEEWRMRYGIQMEKEWQPLEWTGSDLSAGIDIMVDAAFGFAEMDGFTSDMNGMPTFDKIEKTVLMAKCNVMLDNWGIVVFYVSDPYGYKPLWVALCGYKEQLMVQEWAKAEANQDFATAINGLDPHMVGTSVVWRKDMIHRISARDDDGNLSKYDQAERERRKPIERARNLKWSDIYSKWSGAKIWREHLNSSTNLPDRS